MENRLKFYNGEKNNMSDYFDLMAGTSIGSVIVSALSCPIKNTKQN